MLTVQDVYKYIKDQMDKCNVGSIAYETLYDVYLYIHDNMYSTTGPMPPSIFDDVSLSSLEKEEFNKCINEMLGDDKDGEKV